MSNTEDPQYNHDGGMGCLALLLFLFILAIWVTFHLPTVPQHAEAPATSPELDRVPASAPMMNNWLLENTPNAATM